MCHWTGRSDFLSRRAGDFYLRSQLLDFRRTHLYRLLFVFAFCLLCSSRRLSPTFVAVLDLSSTSVSAGESRSVRSLGGICAGHRDITILKAFLNLTLTSRWICVTVPLVVWLCDLIRSWRSKVRICIVIYFSLLCIFVLFSCLCSYA